MMKRRTRGARIHSASVAIRGVFLLTLIVSCGQAGSASDLPGKEIKTVGSSRGFNLPGELANPSICRSNRDIVAIESIEMAKRRHLYWFDIKDAKLHRIAPRVPDEELYAESDREIDWCPKLIGGKQWFVFVSSGSDANDDIYIGNLDDALYLRLTTGAAVDHHPRWCPNGDAIVYVSSRTGNGDLYLIREVTELLTQYEAWRVVPSSKPGFVRSTGPVVLAGRWDEKSHLQLTRNPDMDTYPAWSPDGQLLAYSSHMKTGDRRNAEIFVMSAAEPLDAPVLVTQTATTDELQPSWSGNGRYLAYFVSTAREENETTPSVVGLAYSVIGEATNCRLRGGQRFPAYTVCKDVWRNEYAGPHWGTGDRSLLAIQNIGRDTPFACFPVNDNGAASEALQLGLPGRPDLVQNRQFDLRRTGKGVFATYVSYEGQEYTINTVLWEGDILEPRPQDQPLTPRRFDGTPERIMFGLDLVVPQVRQGFGASFLALRAEFSTREYCFKLFPFSVRGELLIGGIHYEDASISNTVPYIEGMASILPRLPIKDNVIIPFVGIGCGILLSSDGVLAPYNLVERFVFPVRLGIVLKTPTEGQYINFSVTRRFLSELTGSQPHIGPAGFWVVNVGLTYNLRTFL